MILNYPTPKATIVYYFRMLYNLAPHAFSCSSAGVLSLQSSTHNASAWTLAVPGEENFNAGWSLYFDSCSLYKLAPFCKIS